MRAGAFLAGLRRLGGEDLSALLALAVFAVLPAFVEEWRLAEFAIFFIYGLFAASQMFIWGHCGVLSLGQAVFFGVGAYGMSTLTLGMIPGLEGVTSTWLGLLFAAALSAGLAFLLGWFLFSAPRLQGAFFGIVMLAVAFIAERLAINWDFLGGLNGLMNVPPINLGLNGDGAEIWESLPVYYIALGVLAVVAALLRRVIASSFGTVLLAIRERDYRTRALGYDIIRYRVLAFTLAGGVAGLAGALFVTQFGFASPALIGFALSAEVLIWVAVGGRQSLVAAILGAVLVRALESGLSAQLGDYWLLFLGAVFVAVVLLLPRGVIGEAIHLAGRGLGRLSSGHDTDQ